MAENKTPSPRRCTHCGRVVHDTVHYRDAYVVDFHFLYTGEVEMDALWDAHAAVTRVVVHVRNPRFVFTCVDCYALPKVRHERQRLLRPEVEDAP